MKNCSCLRCDKSVNSGDLNQLCFIMAQKPLLDYLETLPDPRLSAKCSHVLSKIIFMATCAMVCGFDTWSEITLFAKEREQWFRRWLTLPSVIPSHDTFNRAFAILPPDSLKAIFQDWIGDILENEQISGQVAIDGKALRATAKGKGASSVGNPPLCALPLRLGDWFEGRRLGVF